MPKQFIHFDVYFSCGREGNISWENGRYTNWPFFLIFIRVILVIDVLDDDRIPIRDNQNTNNCTNNNNNKSEPDKVEHTDHLYARVHLLSAIPSNVCFERDRVCGVFVCQSIQEAYANRLGLGRNVW